MPWRWRNAIAFPAGDHAGEKECASFVTSSTSLPVPSRIAMLLPNASVFVAAMNFPSGEYDGAR